MSRIRDSEAGAGLSAMPVSLPVAGHADDVPTLARHARAGSFLALQAQHTPFVVIDPSARNIVIDPTARS
jgi:hypothetical protein